ncbi:MAG: hypothetical protein KDA96_01430 [Planctomycetaceae bacterium]|nr:hypothetical protein [Planctomycetaceae bacterium]
MTTVRFVGDLPLWAGCLAALIVAVLSWRYYRRESNDLSGAMRWVLPLLRSLAFCLGVMILTGPVLHHRESTGELGRVRIYLDASQSMSMTDVHMPIGRKLLIARELGWLEADQLDESTLALADRLAVAHRRFTDLLNQAPQPAGPESTSTESTSAAAAGSESTPEEAVSEANTGTAESGISPQALAAVRQLLSDLEPVRTQLNAISADGPPSPTFRTVADRMTSDIFEPLIALRDGKSASAIGAGKQPLSEFAVRLAELEKLLRTEFDVHVKALLSSSDAAVSNAVTQFDQLPRWRRADLALLDSPAQILRKLQEQHDVEVILLTEAGAVRRPLESLHSDDAATSLLNDSDVAGLTDLSAGITETQNAVATADSVNSQETPETAIVLFSDGQHNSGTSPLQTAEVLGRQGARFYSIATGAQTPAQDLAIVDLEHPDSVFRRDTVRGVIVIRDQVTAGKPFMAQIRYAGKNVWQQQLLTQDAGERRITFEFPVEELLSQTQAAMDSQVRFHSLPLVFEASISPLAEETDTNNNHQTMRLAAITQEYSALILDGRSRWETRYLRNAFERDQQWHINTVLAGVGTDLLALSRGTQDGQFPDSRDGLFEYDMVVVGDIAANLFTEHELQWLSDFVEVRGGGMIFIDGQRQRLQGLITTQAGNLLPVEWTNEPLESVPAGLELTARGESLPTLMLASDLQKNVSFWKQLPAPHRLSLVRALPGCEVLVNAVVNDRRVPAIVTRQTGAGRVLYMAFDETWRWRYKAADLWHQRFWNQLAQFVMPRPFAVSDDYVAIDSGAVSYDSGAAVDLRVRLRDLSGRVTSTAIADALVWKDGQLVQTISLTADDAVPGTYRGRTDHLPEGDYEISVRAAGYSDSALKARSQFVVHPAESGEMVRTDTNDELLQQMADRSGGVFLREEQVGQLPDMLSPFSSGRLVESELPVWQSYWCFVPFLLLLTLEWAFRKRAGLL